MNIQEPNQHQEEGDLQAPAKLVEALAGLQKTPVFVPPQVDEALLRDARIHFQSFGKRKPYWQTLPPWAALAASVALMGGVIWSLRKQALPLHLSSQVEREDIDQNGRIDIVDALVLARKIETREVSNKNHDFNGDGALDRKDAEAIAIRAVKLQKGGAS